MKERLGMVYLTIMRAVFSFHRISFWEALSV